MDHCEKLAWGRKHFDALNAAGIAGYAEDAPNDLTVQTWLKHYLRKAATDALPPA